MKMVLKVLSEEEKLRESNLDKARFWAKVETPTGKSGFLGAEVSVDSEDNVSLVCPRNSEGSFLRLFPPKPLPEGSIFSLAFNDGTFFELWSGEITKFKGVTEEGLDEYELSSLNQEMNSSERQSERLAVSVPLKLKTTSKFNRTFAFSGCELSQNGLGLWFPASAKSKISIDQVYDLTFEPKEVEPFSFQVKCVRPNCEDSFSKGFIAGFTFVDLDPNQLSALRLNQLLDARGKIAQPDLSKTGHYLAKYYESDFLNELKK